VVPGNSRHEPLVQFIKEARQSFSEQLVRAIASRYRLVLLSNTNTIHFEMIRAAYPLLRHFHAFVLSHEVGEWLDDPFVSNAVNCTDKGFLEVGDPLENGPNYGDYPYTLKGFTYNLQSLVFLGYFGAPRSRSVNSSFNHASVVSRAVKRPLV